MSSTCVRSIVARNASLSRAVLAPVPRPSFIELQLVSLVVRSGMILMRIAVVVGGAVSVL